MAVDFNYYPDIYNLGSYLDTRRKEMLSFIAEKSNNFKINVKEKARDEKPKQDNFLYEIKPDNPETKRKIIESTIPFGY